MQRTVRLLVGTVLSAWVAVAASFPGAPAAEARAQRSGPAYFPDVTLTAHDGRQVRFYDDLLKGKIVAINLIYTTCKYACPLETARLAQVQKLLGDRMGRDIFFYSISIDPEHDTPEVLKGYAEKFHAGPGWLFLTGQRADIELISKKLGLYTPPDMANADGHKPFLLVGNEATGQWMRNSAMDNPAFLARTIGDWLNSWQNARKETAPASIPAEAPRFAFDKGQYMFSSRCSACHTIGRGDNIGPDLAGVGASRDRTWLMNFIVAPDKMNAEGDPIAVALRAKYSQARMPNLNLTPQDAAAVIDYIDRQSQVAKTAMARKPANGPELTALVDPYLAIQRALSADRWPGGAASADGVAREAAKLGPAADSIRQAAVRVHQARELSRARAAFADLSDAILIYAKRSSGTLGADVKIAYCPMAQKYWLQKGEKIQNPFHGTSMSECGRFAAGIPNLEPSAASR